MEYDLGHVWTKPAFTDISGVLILVLMEYGLGQA